MKTLGLAAIVLTLGIPPGCSHDDAEGSSFASTTTTGELPSTEAETSNTSKDAKDESGEGEASNEKESSQTEGELDSEAAEDDSDGGMAESEESETSGDEREGSEPDPELPALDPFFMFRNIIFYNKWIEPVDEPVPANVIRHSNDLYSAKLTPEQISALGTASGLTMNVTIHARCDNYDRIGGVYLAFVPKGEKEFDGRRTKRAEIARFITPFMDKNKKPDRVPYRYNLDYLTSVFRNESVLEEFDIWVQFEASGSPARDKIAGCIDRMDVFGGTLQMVPTLTERRADKGDVVPLSVRRRLNNFQKDGTDELGTTRKTIPFTLEEDATIDFVLVVSQHGANQGGEEYNRRNHFVYVDGALLGKFKPGRKTCEPFRKYNTQPNGIYGPYPRTEAQWQAFSNWCPGDVIDTRIFSKKLSAGEHEFVIDVPDAVFRDQHGNIPLSLYLLVPDGA